MGGMWAMRYCGCVTYVLTLDGVVTWGKCGTVTGGDVDGGIEFGIGHGYLYIYSKSQCGKNLWRTFEA